MFYRSPSNTSRRPGVVLLVVMAMLALFASLALTFVFYADAEAVATTMGLQAASNDQPEVDPDVLANYFLRELIYGSNNPYSAMAGWNLAASIYGNNPGALNYTPYNGIGHEVQRRNINFGATAVDNFNLVNYQKFDGAASAADPLLGSLRMNEFVPGATINTANWGANIAAITTGTAHGLVAGQAVLVSGVSVGAYNGVYTVATAPTATTFTYALTSTAAINPGAGGSMSRYVGGANPPWTSYDTNSLFLAQVDAAGNVYMPSFMRPWHKSTFGTYPPAVQDAVAKYISLFPDSPSNRPIGTNWWNPKFILPDVDASGNQVKNLDFGPGMNDSNWMDLGIGIFTAPNGKRYKPLFAPLIVDMSNKLHLWAHGNRLGGTAAIPNHVSNQGFGAHEVNLIRALGVAIISINEGANGLVTVTTATPHGLAAGDSVYIANFSPPVADYNGTWTVLPGPTTSTFSYVNPTLGLGASAGGTALPVAELQALFNLRLGGTNGTAASVPMTTSAAISTVADANGLVTVTTTAAHGFSAGQRIAITGVANANYNGFYTISSVGPAATRFQYVVQRPGLANSTGGTVIAVPNLRPGTPGTLIDADGLDPTAALSSRPFFMPVGRFTASVTPALPAVMMGPLSRTVTVANIATGAPPAVDTTGAFPLYFFDTVAVGSVVSVGGESVSITAVNPALSQFTATFAQTHPTAGNLALIASYQSAPSYPASWQNAAGTGSELVNNPLLVNLQFPLAPNTAPLPASHLEAPLRWGHTGSPALTSDLFRRMPNTFSNIRSRNMVTLASSHFDRVTGAPYLNFDRNTVAQVKYGFVTGAAYPTLGVNEVQQVTVVGTAGNTYKLTIPGVGGPTAAINFNAPATGGGNSMQTKLRNILPVGGTVSVTLISGTATQRVYSVAFGGTLSNLDVAKMTAGNFVGNPAPTVTITPLQTGQTLPAGPTYTTPASAITTAGSEFGPDWRSTLGQLLRVDLSRPLRDYPPAAAGNNLIANTAAGSPFDLAQKDRQQFALDLYNALVRVTGARDPNVNAGMNPTASDYQAVRWLAQLAVNIVDFIDNDDYSTPFNWYPAAAAPEGWVFGTELPRLVLNEAYAQQEANGTVNLWAELYNPYKASAAGTFPVDQGTAILQRTAAAVANPPYIIEIHAKDGTLDTTLQNPANATGAATTTALATQTQWGTTTSTTKVLPATNAAGATATTARVILTNQIAASPNGATHAGTTVTIKTTAAHGLTAQDVGKPISIVGVADPTYDGTFVITGVTATTFTYINATLPAATAPSGGGPANTVTYGANSNSSQGFYVIGSATAPYDSTPRNPKLLATYLSPTGMTFSNQSVNIAAATPVAPNQPGATHGAVTAAGTTVTINVTAALPARFVVGESVQISGVIATNGTLPAYNTPVGGPYPQIKTIAANRLSFTFDMPQPQAGTLPGAGVTSGSPAAPAPQASVSIAFPQGLTLLLRRLANPHLPFNNAPGATYNPYITVDRFDGLNVVAPAAAIGNTVGRAQPYASTVVGAAGPNTFFNQNVPGASYNWLVHLDRPPVNPIELLHVSGYRPHELTQKFVSGAGAPYSHYAPWSDANALIYRLLDQTSTHYSAGQITGGRFQGNINLNTLMEREIFRALCDPHDNTTTQFPNPWFTQTDVDTVFNKMIAARGVSNAAPPASDGAPFKSFSAAKTNSTGNQVSFDDSWFRLDAGTGQPVFAVGGANSHPYLRAALLQKIYNNITTTSNVFAVWWTVGYFEVVDESVKPARLGPEIGRAQNRHIRHRFFAIVDRSGMQLFNTTSSANAQGAVNLNAAAGIPQSLTVAINAPTGTANGVAIKVQPGMLLEVDSGANAEVVVVTAVNAAGTTITANFAKSHAAGFSIVCRGNPGPQAIYNPHDDPNVVLHMSIIK